MIRGTNLSTAWFYGIAGVWGIHSTNLQVAMCGVECGWRRLPSHELSRWRGAPLVILRLDQHHGKLPLDLLSLLLVMD
jgi:hypothetical protein